MTTEAKEVAGEGTMSVRGEERPVDGLRLIPEFDGKSHDVVEWFEKFELICRLRHIQDLPSIVPLRLTGGAFAVYLQLPSEDKENYHAIKEALISAFAADGFMAYEQFMARTLRQGETVDVYLADLRRLAALIGGLPDRALTYAFVAGLPESTRSLLRAGCRMETMNLQQTLTRARAVLVEETAAVVATAVTATPTRQTLQPDRRVICHACKQPNHFARDCKETSARGGQRGGRTPVRCFRCSQRGHIAAECPGNGDGGEE